MSLTAIGVGYFVFMNIWGFLSMARDKRKAVKHQYRTPERHLWAIAWFGGVFGSILGMQMMRHKTRTLSFRYGMPTLGVVYVFIWCFIFLQIKGYS